MKKFTDDRGFLNKEGEKATAKFKRELKKILGELKLDEIQTMGTLLHKIVGDAVFDAAQAKKELVNKFAAMSDEDFEEYLNNKYTFLHGKDWFFKASLTEEELARQSVLFKKRMEKWAEEQKNRPREQNYGLRLSPRYSGRGKYID